ncbi:hypothetical protein GQ55_1G277100 [Panicum hallii var. hallii]|uniref:Uncharacterized protein n=1 Tax=Panicum hallii var. hallii TaxID=1504633 RepID=A0A2T7F886_9POAL|nr:hypothetical protein GQ55_1G277100 [Panicum hallii var. hallii]
MHGLPPRGAPAVHVRGGRGLVGAGRRVGRLEDRGIANCYCRQNGRKGMTLPCNCIRLAASGEGSRILSRQNGRAAQRPGVRGRPCAPEQAAGRRASARRQRIEAACGRCSGTAQRNGRPGEALRAGGGRRAPRAGRSRLRPVQRNGRAAEGGPARRRVATRKRATRCGCDCRMGL